MELREYIKIIWRYRKLFLSIVFVCVFSGFVWVATRPLEFRSTMGLYVARVGNTNSSDTGLQDQYDDFYRLQADERFADTLVRWLGSPRIVMDITERSKIAHQPKSLSAKRLSSQFIEVTFVSTHRDEALQIAESIKHVLNEKTTSLNIGNVSARWFTVLADEPVVTPVKFSLPVVFSVALLIGIVLGFFTSLTAFYWKGMNR